MARRSRPVRVRASKASAAQTLAAAIAASQRPVGGVPCRVCSLPADIRTVVEQTLVLPISERRMSLPQLACELKKVGHDVGTSSLQKHSSRHLGR